MLPILDPTMPNFETPDNFSCWKYYVLVHWGRKWGIEPKMKTLALIGPEISILEQFGQFFQNFTNFRPLHAKILRHQKNKQGS